MLNRLNNPFGNSIGNLPTSYLNSLSYEEQLLMLSKKMEEIISFMNSTLSQEIKDYINVEFNNIMMSSIYDENTETLILYLEREAV